MPIILVLLVGALATLAIHREVDRLERQRIESAFSSAARDAVLVIQRELVYSLDLVQDINSFFEASDNVSRREFREFVHPVVKRDPSIVSLAWVPKVEVQDLKRFLSDARQSFPRLDIFAAPGNDQAGPSLPAHFPLLYLQPYRSGVTPLGLDLASIAEEAAPMLQAIESGRIQVRGGIPVIPGHAPDNQVTFYAPVYWQPHEDEAEGQPPVQRERRPEALRGFVIGRFHIKELVERALSNLSPSGIDLHIRKPSQGDGSQLLHQHPSRARALNGMADLDQNFRPPDQEYRGTLKIGDEQWEILCSSVPGYFKPSTLEGHLILTGGASFTMLFAAYLFSLLGRARQVRLLVTERTLQLESANMALRRQVDERMRAERALQRLNLTLEERVAHRTGEAERRAAELEQFAYVASHDLKAPLRAIANLAEWLEDDLTERLTPETSEQLQLLRDRVNRMHLLIEGLLSYSRIGRTEKSVTEVDSGELIRETLDSLAPPPGFVFEVAPDMPLLVTDRLQLGQVFANLIGNSVKHHHLDRGRIRIGGLDLGAFCEFSVADDGPGIPPEYQDKVFKMFQTLKTSDYAGDTGIGLALAKKIVEEHRGRIQLNSEPGKGSTFRFTWYKNRNGAAD